MKVCLGGTFSIIHAGHEALLHKAFHIGDQVVIGLTSDEMARQRGKVVMPYEKRKQRLQEFIRGIGRAADIVPLDDEYGPAASGTCDAIVVSPETVAVAEKINDVRRSHGLAPLRIVIVPYVLADDGIPISSSRISNGEIENGCRQTTLHVAVGTTNKMKRSTAEEAFRRWFGHLEITCTAVDVESPTNPVGGHIWRGARQRAEQARSVASADYGVGIEAGVAVHYDTAMLEHVCALVDGVDYVTWGTAPAFQIPPGLAENLQSKNIGNLVPDNEGSLAAFLSDGAVTREYLVREAVTAALLPRLRGGDVG